MTIATLTLLAAEGGTEFSIFSAMIREWYLIFPLVLASIVVMAIGVERYLFVKKASEQARLLFEQVSQMAQSGAGPQEILPLVENAFSGAMYKALYGAPFQQQTTAAAMERSRVGDIAAAKRGLWFVGTMGNLAPFFGLFGTVVGIIQSFMDIAKTGGGGFAVVSMGISTALVATAAGIFVGILAVFIFNFINVLIGKLTAELRAYGEEAYEARLVRLARERAAPRAAPQPAT